MCCNGTICEELERTLSRCLRRNCTPSNWELRRGAPHHFHEARTCRRRRPLVRLNGPTLRDAPELTAAMLAQAEVFEGNVFVRRGRGRPKADAVKEQISVRLDPHVLTALRAAGPGGGNCRKIVLLR